MTRAEYANPFSRLQAMGWECRGRQTASGMFAKYINGGYQPNTQFYHC